MRSDAEAFDVQEAEESAEATEVVGILDAFDRSVFIEEVSTNVWVCEPFCFSLKNEIFSLSTW